MTILFGLTALVATFASAMAVSRANAVHALLYLIVSLLAVAGELALLGAHLAAVLEIIVYAGAIVVLFVFVVTLLAQTPEEMAHERALMQPRAWIGPSILTAILLAELIAAVASGADLGPVAAPVGAKQVAIALYGPYLVAVEAASFLLLAGLIGAWHVGRGYRQRAARQDVEPLRKAS